MSRARGRLLSATVGLAFAASSLLATDPAIGRVYPRASALYATPELAAGAAFVFGSPRIGETLRAGRFARVRVQNGSLEGSPFDGYILVQHLPHGWQGVGIFENRCFVETHAPPNVAAALLHGVTIPAGGSRCDAGEHDLGSTAEVTAVREAMTGPYVPYVAVVGRFAMGTWYGAGGGEALFRREADGGWHVLSSGGGAMSDDELTHEYGVPAADACVLAQMPKCP